MNFFFITLVVFLLATPQAFAHGGRTDKNGGHNCSQASKDKGLCTGYHYHRRDQSSQDNDLVITPVLPDKHQHNNEKIRAHD